MSMERVKDQGKICLKDTARRPDVQYIFTAYPISLGNGADLLIIQ